MALFDLIELGELFASWRLFVGLAVTGVASWLVHQAIPDGNGAWVAAAAVGIAGGLLSFRWQVHADFGR